MNHLIHITQFLTEYTDFNSKCVENTHFAGEFFTKTNLFILKKSEYLKDYIN